MDDSGKTSVTEVGFVESGTGCSGVELDPVELSIGESGFCIWAVAFGIIATESNRLVSRAVIQRFIITSQISHLLQQFHSPSVKCSTTIKTDWLASVY
jgi:hypothetical protein